MALWCPYGGLLLLMRDVTLYHTVEFERCAASNVVGCVTKWSCALEKCVGCLAKVVCPSRTQ